jgi:hypothetical protein
MRRLEDGRCNSWIRNGKHANGVPSLFVDIRHPDERHPWDLKRWFSNIDIPEYKEFREEGLPHSDFEYALIEGKGLEKAKELGYVPDTVPPYSKYLLLSPILAWYTDASPRVMLFFDPLGYLDSAILLPIYGDFRPGFVVSARHRPPQLVFSLGYPAFLDTRRSPPILDGGQMGF